MTTPNPASHEPHPDPVALTSNPDASKNSSTGVDYEPHPESSIEVSAERQEIVRKICALYSGSASEEDMMVRFFFAYCLSQFHFELDLSRALDFRAWH